MTPDTKPTLISTLKPAGKGPYVWAVVIMTLIGGMLVIGILYLRPQSDPLDVLAQVMKGLAPTTAGVLAFMKSQETHLSVNSRLDAFMAEHGKASHAEGVIQGAADEQSRASAENAKIAAAKSAAAAIKTAPGNIPIAVAPVVVVAPDKEP